MNNSLLDNPQLMHLGPAVSQYIHHSSLLLVSVFLQKRSVPYTRLHKSPLEIDWDRAACLARG